MKLVYVENEKLYNRASRRFKNQSEVIWISKSVEVVKNHSGVILIGDGKDFFRSIEDAQEFVNRFNSRVDKMGLKRPWIAHLWNHMECPPPKHILESMNLAKLLNDFVNNKTVECVFVYCCWNSKETLYTLRDYARERGVRCYVVYGDVVKQLKCWLVYNTIAGDVCKLLLYWRQDMKLKSMIKMKREYDFGSFLPTDSIRHWQFVRDFSLEINKENVTQLMCCCGFDNVLHCNADGCEAVNVNGYRLGFQKIWLAYRTFRRDSSVLRKKMDAVWKAEGWPVAYKKLIYNEYVNNLCWFYIRDFRVQQFLEYYKFKVIRLPLPYDVYSGSIYMHSKDYTVKYMHIDSMWEGVIAKEKKYFWKWPMGSRIDVNICVDDSGGLGLYEKIEEIGCCEENILLRDGFVFDEVNEGIFDKRDKINILFAPSNLNISKCDSGHYINRLIADYANKHTGVNFSVKYHPTELGDYADEMSLNNNVRIWNSNESIFDAIEWADIVFTTVSTVIIQALSKGKMTFVFKDFDNIDFEEPYKAIIPIFQTAKGAMEYLNRLIEDPAFRSDELGRQRTGVKKMSLPVDYDKNVEIKNIVMRIISSARNNEEY